MSNLPKSVEILFNNPKLDIAKALIIIYILSNRKKSIKVGEYIYYSIINNCYDENVSSEINLRCSYFEINNTLKLTLLNLCNLGYIELDNKDCKSLIDLYIVIKDKGKKVAVELQGAYYEHLKENIAILNKQFKYTKKEIVRMVEGTNEGA